MRRTRHTRRLLRPLQALETEVKILRQLSHPHIVQLKEVCSVPRTHTARTP